MDASKSPADVSHRSGGGEKGLPKVAIIVLNWNGWEDTLECLESLQRLQYPEFLIIVVDNGSGNDSVRRIKEWCAGRIRVHEKHVTPGTSPKPVQLIEYDREVAERGGDASKEQRIENVPANRKMVLIHAGGNLGFSGGNNIAIRYAMETRRFKYVWLLNNDALAAGDALSNLIRVAEAEKGSGLLGSKLLDYFRPERPPNTGGFHRIWPFRSKVPIRAPGQDFQRTTWLSGASLLARVRAVETIGNLDDRFFLYGEDKDWCLRATRKGWDLFCVLTSTVWHKWGRSSNSVRSHGSFFGKAISRLSREAFESTMYYESRNGVYFYKKHYPLYFVLYLIFRTLHLLLQVVLYDDRKMSRIAVVLKGAWDGLLGRMGKARAQERAGNP